MAVNPMMESARVNGLNSAIKGMNQTAQDVAELNVDDEVVAVASSKDGGRRPSVIDTANDVDDRDEALVSLKLYQREVQATAKVVETADAVLGFLLDVHA